MRAIHNQRSLKNEKFGTVTQNLKKAIKAARVKKGLTMECFLRPLGIRRKKLEDIESPKNYGCYLDLEVAAAICEELEIDFQEAMAGKVVSIN